jgi:ABC-type multidrug transport system fused ATPase/permease subunit
MIASLIISAVFGAVVSAVTGFDFLFWIAGGVFFICLLPFVLLSSFVHGEVSYAQDRADYRQEMSELKAEELADAREFTEDERLNRVIRSLKTQTNIYDNRQVHFHEESKHTDSDQKGVR